MSAERLVLYVTVPNDEVGAQIAGALVEERLAACVNQIPGVRSTYFWKDQVCVDNELLLVVKTRASLFEAVRARVLELHPYTVPEVIALPIAQGHSDYLAWIDEVTRPAG